MLLRLEPGAWDEPLTRAEIAEAVERRRRELRERPSIEATPCDSCAHRALCASEQLACQAFTHYAGGSRRWHKQPRLPSRARFRRLSDNSI